MQIVIEYVFIHCSICTRGYDIISMWIFTFLRSDSYVINGFSLRERFFVGFRCMQMQCMCISFLFNVMGTGKKGKTTGDSRNLIRGLMEIYWQEVGSH